MSTLTLQLPDSVVRQISDLAARAGISTDEYARRALVRGITAEQQIAWLEERGRGSDPEAVKAIMGRVPDVEPEPHDRIE
jgi:hypothetical protein